MIGGTFPYKFRCGDGWYVDTGHADVGPMTEREAESHIQRIQRAHDTAPAGAVQSLRFTERSS